MILERNFRCRLGEIDLIALEGRTVVFVEVKYRKAPGQGSASAAVTLSKQRTIGKVAEYYLMKHCGTVSLPARFDVMAFDGNEISWIRDAFWVS